MMLLRPCRCTLLLSALQCAVRVQNSCTVLLGADARETHLDCASLSMALD